MFGVKLPAAIRWLLAVCICLLLIFVIAGCTPLSFLLASPLMIAGEPKHADAIVLMSSGQLTGEWLTTDATQRLAGALWLYRKNFAPWIITSGSDLRHGIDQAQLEAEWLVLAGVPRDRILVENTSSRTYESVCQLAILMKKEGFSRLVVVTSEMDVPRIRLTAKKLGLEFSYSAVPEFPRPRGVLYFPAGFGVLYHAAYEYTALALYSSRGWI